MIRIPRNKAEKRRCPVCSKGFGEDDMPWGIRKVKGTWKTSPAFAEADDNAYHMECATRVAQALNKGS